MDTDGQVTTFAGTGIPGDEIGPIEKAQFNGPIGLTIDAVGNIYVVENRNNKIKVIRPS